MIYAREVVAPVIVRIRGALALDGSVGIARDLQASRSVVLERTVAQSNVRSSLAAGCRATGRPALRPFLVWSRNAPLLAVDASKDLASFH